MTEIICYFAGLLGGYIVASARHRAALHKRAMAAMDIFPQAGKPGALRSLYAISYMSDPNDHLADDMKKIEEHDAHWALAIQNPFHALTQRSSN